MSTNQTSDNAIDAYIEEMQKGKSGIYPYRLAQDVASNFTIPMARAKEAVLKHIRIVSSGIEK